MPSNPLLAYNKISRHLSFFSLLAFLNLKDPVHVPVLIDNLQAWSLEPTTYMAGHANMDFFLILDLPFLRSTSPPCFQATNPQWETTFAIYVWTLQPSIPWFGFRDFRWRETASNSIPTDKKSDFLADVASTANAIGLRAWFVINVEKHRCSQLLNQNELLAASLLSAINNWIF